MRRHPGHEASLARPILKWAGGMRQLLPELRSYYPPSFTRYVEPFVGSGAVFLDLHNAGRLDGRDVRLSDVNADIIGCYRMVRDRVEEVIEALQVLAGSDPSARYTPELAAMLIYLNRTGYNGLFRVNAQGAFNVPAGRYSSVRICDGDNVRGLAAALGRPGVSLAVQPFEEGLQDTTAGDFVYLDPPYAPVSRTAHFTSYAAARFGSEQQVSLQRSVIALAARGAQQFGSWRHRRTLRAKRGGRPCRADDAKGQGPPGHQLPRLGPRPGVRIPDYERPLRQAPGPARPSGGAWKTARNYCTGATFV